MLFNFDALQLSCWVFSAIISTSLTGGIAFWQTFRMISLGSIASLPNGFGKLFP